MARTATGQDHLAAALALLDGAQSADQLRLAQAVLLPLTLGLSLEQTAQAIGRSVSATCAMRTRFCRVAAGEQAPPRAKHTLRNRAYAGLADEVRLLEGVCGRARQARADLVPRLQQAMKVAYGTPIALSSVYRLLHRHGWSRLVASASLQPAPPPGHKERRSRPQPHWVRA